MSELGEKRWAVISERGCEAAGLAYGEAARLSRTLRDEKISGLCVITDAAAARLKQPPKNNGKAPANRPARRKPARRKVSPPPPPSEDPPSSLL